MAGNSVDAGGSRYAQAQLIGPGLCQQALRLYPGRLAYYERVKPLNFAATDGTGRFDVDTLQSSSVASQSCRTLLGTRAHSLVPRSTRSADADRARPQPIHEMSAESVANHKPCANGAQQ